MRISTVKWSFVVALLVAGCVTSKNRNASGDAVPAKSDASPQEQRAVGGKPAIDASQAGHALTSLPEKPTAAEKRTRNLSRADNALTDEAVAARFGLTVDLVRRLHTQRALSNEAIVIMPPAKLARAVWRLGHPKADHPDEAMKFRLQQQVDEGGKIPANALMNAVAEKKAMAVDPAAWKQFQKVEGPAADGSPLTAGIQPAAWTWNGPGNIGGRIRSILIHPTTPTTMWAGSVGGGIWKTTNSGTSWAPVDDFMANLAVSTLAMDPTNSNVLYAGTGEGFYNVDGIRGAGIFKSINGGTTWTQLASTTGSTFHYVNRLAIHPTNGQIILAATRSGIFRSTDGGTSWSQRTTADTMDIDFNPTDATRCVASGRLGLALYSTDGGVTWIAATGLTATGRVEVAYSASSPTTVYASQERNSGELYQSTNGGQSYTLKNTGTNYLGGQGWYDNALWVDPTNPAIVIVGGIDLYRSTNSGTTLSQISQWFSAPTSAHADHHFIVHQPGFNGTTNKTVFFGNDGGVYRATDVYTVANTIGWQELNNNLGVTQLYGAAGNATTGVIVAGTQDNGTLRFTTAGGTENWSTMFGGDGGWCASDPLDSNYFYGEYVYANVHRSSNAGVSSDYISGQYWNNSAWVFKAAPYVITDAQTNSAQFISPFVIDPNAPNRMLVGGASLWRTNDVKTANTNSVGPTWANIKASIGSNITAIAVAPGNSDIVWVGHANGNVYKTTNGTAVTPTWTPVDNGAPNLPNRYCTRITIHPTNSSKVYVTFGGFNADNVWRTDNAGVNWVNISGTLPAAPVRSLVIGPMEPNYLYVGTEVGIFASADAGANWSPTNEGPANVSVDELFWMGNKLVAATHGRGVFSVLVSVVPVITAFGTAVTSETGLPNNGTVDPGETVTVNFSLKNTGTVAATNLVATLAATGGVTLPGSAQTYGAMASNATVTRPFTFTATGPCGGTVTATLQLTDGATNLGSVTFTIPLGVPGTPVITPGANAAAITIVDNANASPYPSNITLSGVFGSVTKVTATVSGISHTYPEDIDMELVGPGGQSCVLMAAKGGGGDVNGVNLTFDASAAGQLTTGQITSGTYQPSGSLSVFNGTSANGSWGLRVRDTFAQDPGSISGGWSLAVTTVSSSCINTNADLSVVAAGYPSPVAGGQNFAFEYVVQNNGPSNAAGVAFTAPLPGGVTFISATSTVGTCTQSAGTVTGNIGALAPGAKATITIVARAAALFSGALSSTGTVASNQTDPITGNNSQASTVTVQADSDGDGMPNVFESLYFGSSTAGNPTLDLDGDGLTNLREFYAGTSAGDSNSYLRVSAFTLSGGAAHITFGSVNGRRYRVRFTDNLITGPWNLLSDNIVGTGAALVIDDPGATGPPSGPSARFYKIETIQP